MVPMPPPPTRKSMHAPPRTEYAPARLACEKSCTSTIAYTYQAGPSMAKLSAAVECRVRNGPATKKEEKKKEKKSKHIAGSRVDIAGSPGSHHSKAEAAVAAPAADECLVKTVQDVKRRPVLVRVAPGPVGVERVIVVVKTGPHAHQP